MEKKKMFFLFRKFLIPCVILCVVALGVKNVTGKTPAKDGNADIVEIDISHVAGKKEMSSVSFRHDRHVESIPGENNCLKCHLEKQGRLVWKFKRLKNHEPDEDMNIYHDNCIACHARYKKRGKSSGPLEANCRACHSSKREHNSNWIELEFDKSLHSRHVGLISENSRNRKDCGTCHHVYDKQKRQTVYIKGREDNCRYCHKTKAQNATTSFRQAAHDSCVACHQDLKAKGAKAGPFLCKSCHTAEGQKKINKAEKIDRIMRKQPDIVLLASWAGKKETGNNIKAVWFDHKQHESKTAKCISCHHKSMERCGTCHNTEGGEKGGFVSLETAMHTKNSSRSCLGCHLSKVKEPSCAACHWMQSERFGKNSCAKCHTLKQEKVNTLLRSTTNTGKVVFESIKSTLPINRNNEEDLKIPEKVTIGVMVDKYDAVEFPHRKVFKAIKKRIDGKSLATYFHGTEKTLCLGCHHNSPKSNNPPKCISCHQAVQSKELTGKTTLKGAYHGQCITCHQKMDIKSPSATECLECHQQRRRSNKIQIKKS